MVQSSSAQRSLTAREGREKLWFRARARLRHFPFEFQRRELAKTGVRTHFVVAAPELFDHHLRVDPVLEPLHAQALVAELAIERLVRAVLPRLAGVDMCGVDVST